MGIFLKKNFFVEEIPDETPDIPDVDTDSVSGSKKITVWIY